MQHRKSFNSSLKRNSRHFHEIFFAENNSNYVLSKLCLPSHHRIPSVDPKALQKKNFFRVDLPCVTDKQTFVHNCWMRKKNFTDEIWCLPSASASHPTSTNPLIDPKTRNIVFLWKNLTYSVKNRNLFSFRKFLMKSPSEDLHFPIFILIPDFTYLHNIRSLKVKSNWLLDSKLLALEVLSYFVQEGSGWPSV